MSSFRSRDTSRRGFTLMELLIVAGLISVLMLGVWTMFRTWTRLYTHGQTRAARLQLIRSLCDQFTDDIRAAHQAPPRRPRQDAPAADGSPPPPPAPDNSANNNPTFMGGSDWLLVEVIQTANPWQTAQDSDATEVSATEYGTSDKQAAPLIVPELQLVLYSFVPPASDPLDSLSMTVDALAADDDVETIVGDDDEKPPVSGLQRLTIAQEYLGAWSAVIGQRAEAGEMKGPRDVILWIREQVSGLDEDTDPLASSSSSMVGLDAKSSSDTDLLASVLERDDVPEIAWLEFRYFDGSSWRSSWESDSSGGLPVAVEMRFELTEERKTPVGPSSDDDTELVDERTEGMRGAERPMPDSATDTRIDERATRIGTAEETAPTYRRCVIYLNPPNQPQGRMRSSGSGGTPPSEPR